MSSIRILSILILFILLFSCNEESVTNVKKEKDKEEEVHISNLVPPFTIHQVLPDYTFWNHQFKITLKYDMNSDSVNTNFYFTGRKLNPIEKAKSGEYLTYTFLTPGNAVSDSIEIRYYEEDDSISVYSRFFEVVNSEVKLDSVHLANLNFIKVYLNNYKYKDYLTVSFKDSITKGFESRYNYLNSSPNYQGMFGEFIDESYLLFPNSYIQSFALRIEAKEEINKSKQLHSYDYIYKSQKDIINNNITDNELKIELVDSYYGNDDYIYLKFRNIYNIEYINKLIFENNEVNKWELKFKPYIKESKEDDITEELAELKFPKPKKIRFGVVDLFYSDGNDTTFKIDFGFKNLFESSQIEINNITLEYEIINGFGDYDNLVKNIKRFNKLNQNQGKITIDIKENNKFNLTTDTIILDKYNYNVKVPLRKDSLLLNSLEGEEIDFTYKINSYIFEEFIKGEIITEIKYKGKCIVNENEKEIQILIQNNQFDNLSVNRFLSLNENNSNKTFSSLNASSKPNFLFDNNSYIKLIFEK